MNQGWSLLGLLSPRFTFRFVLKLTLISLSLYSVLEMYKWSNKEYGNPWDLNYFLDEKDRVEFENVIETPRCKIMKMSPWDKGILPFIKPKKVPPDCSLRNRNWFHLQGTKLILNKVGMEESGYSLNSLRCCYKAILRVEQSLENFDKNADEEVRYSDDCKELREGGTEIEDEFIRVFCTSTSWPYGVVVYRNFFALPLPPKSSRKKIEFWRKKLASNGQIKNKTGSSQTDYNGIKASSQTLPPSVVMIGIDAMSRMNFHRSFNETKAFLQDIGGVEFLGYTKVGENTLPNTVSFLTGYSSADLAKSCLRTPETPKDSCPFIWKGFDEAKYLTATVEDAPGLVGFNYNQLGFVNRPTDFYFRPFMLAVHKSLPRMDYYHTDCIGRLTTEETMLNYVAGIMAHSSTIPVFVHTWMTSLVHIDMNGGKFADPVIAKFLKSADLSNTVIILLGDHGQRYGAIRETFAGWYEDKLPILTIYLPPTVTSKFPTWKDALLTNSRRLTSPFDLYKTIDQLLYSFNSREPTPDHEETGIPRNYGQSLFTPIDTSRSCSDAGIAVNYCACVPPRKLNSRDPRLILAAKAAVSYLNRVTPSQCKELELDRISAGALLNNEDDADGTVYVVTFYTLPGDFLFEANVNYNAAFNNFSITTDLLRMNRIVRDASCVSTSLLERYCYCS